MLTEIGVDNAIVSVVEGILTKGNTKQVLYVHVDWRLDLDGDYDTRDVAVGVHFLVWAPSNYVNVYAAVDKSFIGGRFSEPRKWILQSSHDSCWRDGFRLVDDLYTAAIMENPRWENQKRNKQTLLDLCPDEMNVEPCEKPRRWVRINKMELHSIDELKGVLGDFRGEEKPIIEKWYYEDRD